MGTGKVYAVGMLRDEEDVALHVLLHLASEGVDGIVVANNLSVDATPRLLEEAARTIRGANPGFDFLLVDDPEMGYFQARKTTGLARMAAERGAEWIVPFDADEIWYAPDQRLADFLRATPAHTNIVTAALINHFCTAQDPSTEVPFQRMAWHQTDAARLPKIAFRWHPSAQVQQGNHVVHFDIPVSSTSGLEIRHFPYRSEAQFIRKARNGKQAYDASNLPADVGTHWRMYGEALERGGEEAIRWRFRESFYYKDPAASGLVHDPAPFRRWS